VVLTVERSMADGFLGRWSQRKQAARSGQPLAEPKAPPAEAPGVTAQASAGATNPPVTAADATAPSVAQGQKPSTPPPTLEDVQALTSQDSFARFVAPDVAPAVRNAAMKKLFADPHFNVMDGLDIYIDDYSKPSPLPAAMLQKMASAQFLKLVQEPEPPQESPGPSGAASTLHSDPLPTPEPDHDHPDLRLQPDDAAGRAGLERQPEPAPEAAQQPVPPPSC